ncbi:MAG: ACP S-malonyltransferase [Bdellovibrionales bacterium]|nr:ACP S-malonyltransferase [Bdellovibrionales bacterium]
MSDPRMPLAFFPGQGSQHVGMAKELYENFKIARETFEEASDATRVDLKKLCFDGPESDLQLTENTQPALLTASIAAFRVAEIEKGFKPSAVAGHSLGEYSALVAAGAFPLASAAAWVRERGRAMQTAVPAGQGGMAAILSVEDDVIEKLCLAAVRSAEAKRLSGAKEITVDCVLSPANFNAPGQTVIAGAADAVNEAVALLKAGGEFSGKAIPLAVSAPFHCRLMAPARARMAELFKNAKDAEKPKTLRYPYVPNRTAKLTNEASVVFELLVEQVDHPVLWRQTGAMLIERGYKSAVEFGPGKVLAGLAKRISSAAAQAFVCTGVSDVKTLNELAAYV